MTDNLVEEFDIDAIRQSLADLRNTDAEQEARITAARARLNSITAELNALTKEKRSLEGARQTNKVVIRSYEIDLEKAERIEKVKQDKARLMADYEQAAAEFAKLTADSVWRSGDTQGHKAFEYQLSGATRLAVAKRGILGDKRGLGKTLTSIVWADMVQAKKIILVAPNDVVSQFEGEIRNWAPHRMIFSLAGQNPSTRNMMFQLMAMTPEFVVTINYEAWRKDKTTIDRLVSLGCDTLMIDEAHRAKASDKLTARGIFQLAYRPNYCEKCEFASNFHGAWAQPNDGVKDLFTFKHSRDRKGGEHLCPVCQTVLTNTVKNVLPMTGTPFLNKPQELFSLLFLVDPVAFPTESKFLDDYCDMGYDQRWKFKPGGLDRLTKYMAAFFVQRKREDIGSDVPPPAIITHYIEKDKVKYKKQYEAEKRINSEAHMLLEDGTRKDIFFVLELILRQRQCMTWPAGITINDEDGNTLCNFDVEESQKLDEVTDLLMELCEEGERVVVFSQFKPPLKELQKRLSQAGVRVTMATGDESKFHREQVMYDFDLKTASPENYKWQVVFATFKAFGTGINLNAARHLITVDDEWSPGLEDQAIGRIDRINSTDQATVHQFRVKSSVDDFMESLLKQKREMTDGFVDSITTADLMRVFM